MSSQHFSAWSSSQIRVWAKPWNLALPRHVWLSFRISAAVSRLVSQSSSFVESHPSNVEMSWSKDMVRIVCHYVTHKESVYFCIAMCRGSSMGLGVGCGWSVTVSCCHLLVSFANSSTYAGGCKVYSIWMSCSCRCWNCSCNLARSWQRLGPCCIWWVIHHLAWAHCCLVVYCPGERCSVGEGNPQCHHTWWSDIHISLLCHEFC